MPAQLTCFSYHITGVTHGATPLAKATGASIQETIGWIASKGDGAVSENCLEIESYVCEAEVTFEKLATPLAKTTSAATLSILTLGEGGNTATVAVPTMKVGAAGFDFNGKPHTERQSFRYTGTSVNPITVGA